MSLEINYVIDQAKELSVNVQKMAVCKDPSAHMIKHLNKEFDRTAQLIRQMHAAINADALVNVPIRQLEKISVACNKLESEIHSIKMAVTRTQQNLKQGDSRAKRLAKILTSLEGLKNQDHQLNILLSHRISLCIKEELAMRKVDVSPRSHFLPCPIPPSSSHKSYKKDPLQIQCDSLKRLIEYLQMHDAAQAEGIFRVTGNREEVAYFKEEASQGQVFPQIPDNMSVYTIASLIKSQLADVPLPASYIDQVLNLVEKSPPDCHLECIDVLTNDLAPSQIESLQILMNFLNEVVDNTQTSKMTKENLAVVFAQTLFPRSTLDLAEAFSKEQYSRQAFLLIFSYFTSDEKKSALNTSGVVV